MENIETFNQYKNDKVLNNLLLSEYFKMRIRSRYNSKKNLEAYSKFRETFPPQ